MLDRIAQLSVDRDPYLKMLLYGRSKTGKTTFWGSFPGPTLALICSGGNQTGELKSLGTPEHREKVTFVTLRESEEVREVTDAIKDGRLGVTTLVLDHASGLQDMVLKEILGLEELPAQKSWGMASQQLYGQMAGACKDLFRRMLSLDCNVVIVAQERTFGGSDDGDSDVITPTIGAGVSPSLAGWLNSAVDYIVQTHIRGREEVRKTVIGKGDKAKEIETRVRVPGRDYCLRIQPDAVYAAGFRAPKGTPLPEYVVDPDYEKIMALVRGGG